MSEAMRHLEVLIEDSSGARVLEILLPAILAEDATFKILSYKGLGAIPQGMRAGSDPNKRILLEQLPRIIQGYGRAFKDDGPEYRREVLLVCDLDDRNRDEFCAEITSIIDRCNPSPVVHLAFCIEEIEAWLLGDESAILTAYPLADKALLAKYIPDSICGTWETLADIVAKNGARTLKAQGFYAVGAAKHEWANKITPCISIERNRSPSFQSFAKMLS